MGKAKKSRKTLETSSIQWNDWATPASEFVTQHDLPQIVKVNTGNYGNLSCGGSDVDVTQPFLLHTSRPQGEKVLAQIVKWDGSEGGGYVDTGTHLIVPVNYPGWFTVTGDSNPEPLRPWVSLRDIPHKETTSVLATKLVTCFMLSEDTSVGEKVYLNTDCSAGEVFELGDLYVERITRAVPTCCMTWLTGGKTTKESVEETEYLLCQDSHSTDLLIPTFTKGYFYRVDGPKQSDGVCEDTVYRICDILNYVDLPCYVQLVHGTSPRNINLSSSIIRLEEKFKEDTIVACSLQLSPKFTLLEFPLDTDIEFIHTRNNTELLNQCYLQDAIQYCFQQVTPYIVGIKIVQNFTPVKPKKKAKPDGKSKRPVISGPILSDGGLEKFMSQGQHGGDTGDRYAFETHDLNQGKKNLDLSSQTTDEFTDEDSSIQQGTECHYETIPCDKGKRRLKDKAGPQTNQEHKETPAEREDLGSSTDFDNLEILPRQRHSDGIEENDEYLVPLNLRRQSFYSNLPNTQTSHTATMQLNLGAICPTNSVNEDDVQALKPSLLNRQLSPIVHDRMDRFLQDSLEELHRTKHISSVADTKPDGETDDDDDGIASDIPGKEELEASGMKAKLDAFLDEIFDYDNLEKGMVSDNLEHVVQLSAPKGDRGFLNSYSLNKSVSASELHEDTITGPFRPICTSSTDDKPDDMQDSDNPSKSENTSSSSRSASSIYRQMKCTQYERAESYHTYSPYHRTDSGIVLSPRYSASEAGYNRDIYKAMSDVAWTPPDELSLLSVEEVGLSLIYIGIKQKEVDHFMDQQIDGEQLMGIDETLLKEAFPDLNGLERKKILDFVHGWRPKKIACY